MLKPAAFAAHLANPQSWNKYAYVLNTPLKAVDPNGLDTYLVTYTTGNSKGDDEMRRAARTRAKEIAKGKGFNPRTDKVIVQGVRTREDFSNALSDANAAAKTSGPVKEVDVFAHSGVDGPVFHEDSAISKDNPHGAIQLSPSDLSNLPQLNWASGATTTFYGCNSGGFGPAFAQAEHVTTFGTPGPANFSTNPSYASWVGGDHLSNKDDALYLKTFLFNGLPAGPLNPALQMDRYDAK